MWRRCLLMLAGVLLLCALPAVAAAHTELVRADPADGAVLAESPGLAQLWFSGDIAASRSTARLVNDRGDTVPGAQLVRGSGDPRVIAVELPSLADGGVPVTDIAAAYPNTDWDAVCGEMFLEP